MAARGGYKGGTKRRHSERARRPYSRVFYFLDKIPAYVHKIHLRGKWSAHAGKSAAAPVLVVSAIPFRTRQAPRKAVLMSYMIKYPHTAEKAVYGANNALVRRRVLGPSAWPVPEIPFRTRQAPRKAVLFTYTIKSLCRFLKCRYGANTGFLHRDFLFYTS